MPTIEERVTVLEIRVDDLHELARQNAREAACAMAAHHQNTKLLNALRVTQAEHTARLDKHGRILDEHTRKLDEHTRKLDEHDRRFDAIDARLDEHSRILTEHSRILTEHSTILGKLVVGVHHIEQGISQLLERDQN